MNQLAKERNDKEIARALGIRAKQEDLECVSVLYSAEMKDLCQGQNVRGIKMLVGDFLNGWLVQHTLQVAFGARGSIGTITQAEAEKYLKDLPENYFGTITQQESGKWLVSYHRGKRIG